MGCVNCGFVLAALILGKHAFISALSKSVIRS